MPAQEEPTGARIRMYQVGFGDCLLLSFEYAQPLSDGRSERHILFDFGSTHNPQWSGFSMLKVARKIKEHTHGKLDVLVATHRHRDHISGFGTKATSKVIAELQPELVVQPWTEHPKIGEDAEVPIPDGTNFTAAQLKSDMRTMELLAERVATWIRRLPADSEVRARYAGLYELAYDQIKNEEAVRNLETWSDAGRHGAYVFFGEGHKRLEKCVPNVKFTVIGPPTLKQHPGIRSYAPEGDEEYWLAASRDISTLLGSENPDSSGVTIPVAALPIVQRLRDRNATSLFNIVRRMDEFLNNTSVILLIEARQKRLLFGGDAQVENWEYTMKEHPNLWQQLGKIDLYKVGHHGSRNASPVSLVTMWPETPVGEDPAMVALMSTRLHTGHGSEENESEVPRGPLVEAIKKRATLFSTHEMPPGQVWLELEADLAASTPFTLVPPS